MVEWIVYCEDNDPEIYGDYWVALCLEKELQAKTLEALREEMVKKAA